MAVEKRRGLGRGLGALIPQGNTAVAATTAPKGRPVDVFFPDRGDLGPAESTRTPKNADEIVASGALGGQDEPAAKSALSADSGATDSPEKPAKKPGAGFRSEKRDDSKSTAASKPDGSASDVSRETSEVKASSADGDKLDADGAAAKPGRRARKGDPTSGHGNAAADSAGDASVSSSGSASEASPSKTAAAESSFSTDASSTGSASLDQVAIKSAGTEQVSTVQSSAVQVSTVQAGTEQSAVTQGTADRSTVESTSAGETSDSDLVHVPGARFAELNVAEIVPNTKQPRTVFDDDELAELADSILQVGVLQPVIVRDNPAGGYELIMGERRWRATQRAGLDVIPAIIRDTEDSDLLRDALLENLHRAQLNPLEEAAAYEQLLNDFGCTHEELATRIAKSRPQISNTLRLLRLPPLVQRRVAAGVLSAGHARALLGLADGGAMERLAQRIVAEGLSVRATEEIVALGGESESKAKRRTPQAGQRNEALEGLATRLSDRFDTRVKIALGKTKGRLTVEFASVQDLNRIIESIAPEDPGVLK